MMNKTVLAVAISAMFISSCAEFSSVKRGVAFHGANLADEKLTVEAWGICDAMTRGAMLRKFNTPGKMESLDKFCYVFYGKPFGTDENVTVPEG